MSAMAAMVTEGFIIRAVIAVMDIIHPMVTDIAPDGITPPIGIGPTGIEGTVIVAAIKRGGASGVCVACCVAEPITRGENRIF